MKTKTPVNKKILNKKTSAVQKADTINFIREAINDSRSVVKDIAREKHTPESTLISQRAKKSSISIHYGKC